jgi:hypothetical protein
MTTRYGLALDWAAHTLHELRTTRPMVHGTEWIVEAMETQTQEGVTLAVAIAAALVGGRPYYLEKPIADALYEVARTLPPEARFSPDLVPCPSATVYLAQPVPTYCDCEPPCPPKWITGWCWHVSQDRVPGLAYPRVHPGLEADPELATGVLVATFYHDGASHLADLRVAECGFADDLGPMDPAPTVPLIFALWTFLQQELLVAATAHLDRAERRRVERQGAVAQDRAERLQVVYLRRPRHAGGDGAAEHREHDISWVVTGHWRHQACGPHNQERKLRWIFPYIKGDPEKPLRVSAQRIYAVAR